MPSFTGQIGDLRAIGPITEIRVGLPPRLARERSESGASPLEPITVAAMVDTGASATVLRSDVIKSLGLKTIGRSWVQTVSSTEPISVDRFIVSLYLPEGVTVSSAVVVEAPLEGQHIQCLLGRDILSHGILVYIGYLNQFTLSF
ncbi:retroviral-like aspartic protease family protein [bacterium]|nr:retroviral-like aspartic protease family protein [bacterium]